MGIIIKLYGDLREKFSSLINSSGVPITLNIELNNVKTVFDILRKLNFDQKEISTIFVNGKYCGPGKGVRDGDRIGLFPKRMGLMFLEIVTNNTINIKVKLFDRIKKTTEISVAIPEGKTIRYLLDRINRSKGIKQRIMVNNIPCKENDLIIKNGDIISIVPKDLSP
ncbi:hypothetical protein LCGC14_0747070 [marine sediment metagenome]|uniref:Ubiquitin Mut7-C domain-containing protein n=1 Tax=marine sediment metagenome TaxID=412755 RepID=A0A0F9Q518_9ZZZZ